MMFHCCGPVSCRHNDNWTLAKSGVMELLETTQKNKPMKYVTYGDSAYWPEEYLRSRHREDTLTDRQILENNCMSKCRQSIEWDYGQVGNLWKTVTFRKGLKLREQPVRDKITTCFLLTNAYNAMNALQRNILIVPHQHWKSG